MKKLSLVIVFLFAAASYAQMPAQDEIELIQEIFGSEKKAIIEENVDLTGVNADSYRAKERAR